MRWSRVVSDYGFGRIVHHWLIDWGDRSAYLQCERPEDQARFFRFLCEMNEQPR